jgi:hypothetical protein
MKLFASILSLYILFLTTIPCVDAQADNALQKNEISQNTSDNQQNDADCCSPFCSCDCCTSPVLYQDFIIYLNYSTIPQKFKIDYLSSYVSSLFTSIWQPPKIS